MSVLFTLRLTNEVQVAHINNRKSRLFKILITDKIVVDSIQCFSVFHLVFSEVFLFNSL